MQNALNGQMPMGLGMALAENMEALRAFGAMDDAARAMFIQGAHAVRSRQEMRQYVAGLLK